MKNFNEVFQDTITRNEEKRKMLVQTMQPFFTAMIQKKTYDEEYQRKEQEQIKQNTQYGEALAAYRKTGQVPVTAPTDIQAMQFNKEESEKTRKDNLVNQLQQYGLGKDYEEAVAANPTADIDVIFGEMAAKKSDKDNELLAQSLGSKYYAIYQDKIAKNVLPRVALADAANQAKLDEQALSRSYSGSGGGSSSPDVKPLTDAAIRKYQGAIDTQTSILKGMNQGMNKYNIAKNVNVSVATAPQEIKGTTGTKKIIASTADYDKHTYMYNGKNYFVSDGKGGWKTPKSMLDSLKAALASDYGKYKQAAAAQQAASKSYAEALALRDGDNSSGEVDILQGLN